MEILVALKKLRDGRPASEAARPDESLYREAMRLLGELPPEGVAEHFELRESWVARVSASRKIRDREARRAELDASRREFELAERDLFRRYGLRP
jgi:hypothetical protein